MREGPVPIVSCGAGQLHSALLADEISASIGVAESERFVVPATWKKKAKDGKRKGRTRMAYHPRLHCSFRVGASSAALSVDWARGQREQLLVGQARAVRVIQARDALGGDTEERREWVLGSAVKASWTAADADIPGMHTSIAKYKALFEGLDVLSDDIAPGEQAEL